jgi:hypothetical protein
MRTVKKLMGLMMLMASVMFLDACKGEKGDIGPAGPAGPAGPTGATGATGAAGATGTANVIYSAWTNVTFAGSGSNYTGTISAPKLTQDIYDKGAIHVYMKDVSRIITLPYSQVIGGTSYTIHTRYSVGSIDMIASYGLGTLPIRYVLIPGGVTARQAAVDYSDYEAVKKFYNLPD